MATYKRKAERAWDMTNRIRMPEKAFIVRGDMVSVHVALETLRNIVPANNPYVSRSDYKIVMSILSKWTDDMYEAVEMECMTWSSGKK